MISGTLVCLQKTTCESQSVTHVLPHLPTVQRTKILHQLDIYLKIQDDSLTKFTLTTNNQSALLHLNFTTKKEKARESLRELIRNKRFNQSQPQIIKMFAKLCKTVDKMHQAGIAHNAILADRLYIEGNTVKLPLPSFTLISKAKRKHANRDEIPPCLRGLTYECIDIFSLGFILLEMLTKTEQNISTLNTTKLEKAITTVSSHLRALLQKIFAIQSHKTLTISDILSEINKRQINPQTMLHQKRQSQARQEVALFTLFKFCKRTPKMTTTSNNKTQTIIKEAQHFVIYIHYLKNSQALCFDFTSTNHKSIIMTYLYTKNLITGNAVKDFFESMASLFTKLKEKATVIRINSSGEVIISFKTAPKPQKQIIPPQISSKRAAVFKHEQQMREKQEQVKLLFIVAQEEPFRSNKQSLNIVEELINKSRCLSQKSKLVQGINVMWKKMLMPIIRGNNLEDLLTTIRICEKYWLESDQIMNIMKKRVSQILQSGIMNFLY